MYIKLRTKYGYIVNAPIFICQIRRMTKCGNIYCFIINNIVIKCFFQGWTSKATRNLIYIIRNIICIIRNELQSISLDNYNLGDFVDRIYPIELEIK
jgi:hypothetical protein